MFVTFAGLSACGSYLYISNRIYKQAKRQAEPFCCGFDDERWFCPGVLMLVKCWPHLPLLRLASKLF